MTLSFSFFYKFSSSFYARFQSIYIYYLSYFILQTSLIKRDVENILKKLNQKFFFAAAAAEFAAKNFQKDLYC